MNPTQSENESRFLREVLLYRDEYRKGQSAALEMERRQRHASGEVYLAGCWIPDSHAERVAQELRRKDRVVFFEIIVLLVFLTVLAYGIWRLFRFLLLPDLS